MEWQKTPGGTAREWEGGRDAAGHRHPQSGRISMQGQNLQSGHRGQRSDGGRQTGSGSGRKPRHQTSDCRQRSRRRQQWNGARAEDGAAAAPEGHGGRQRQRRAPAAAIRRRRRRQDRKRHAPAPRVRLTGAGGSGGGSIQSGPWERVDGHGATRGTSEKGRTETTTGDKTGQRALLARGMQEDRDEEQIPPNRSHALNARGHPGGKEGWGGLTRQRVHTACSHGRRGTPQHGSALP